MNDKTLSPEESFELITQMINRAKKNFAGGGSFYFLLWGFVIALANLGHYVMLAFTSYPHPYIVWLLVIPATLATIWYSRKHHRGPIRTGDIDRIYGQLWWGIFACIISVLMFMPTINYQSTPIILLFTSLGTYVSGQTLRFRPLVVGGLVIFGCAVVGFLLPQAEQFLLAAIAITAGYLVPGFILKKKESERI